MADRPPWIGVRPGLSALCAGLLFSVLYAGAFAPIGAWPLVFVALVPLAWVGVVVQPRYRWAGAWAALGAVPFWAVQMHWVVAISSVGIVPLVAYLSGLTWVFVWILGRLSRLERLSPVLAVAAAWVFVEFFRGQIMWHGYPWYLAAQPLIDAPPLDLPARIGGVYLVSLLVAVYAGVVLQAVMTRNVRRAAAWTVGLAAAWGVLAWAGGRSVRTPGDPVRIAVLQTELPQSNKMGWSADARLDALDDWLARSTAAVNEGGPGKIDLVVWPETMFPGFFLSSADVSAVLAERERFPEIARFTEYMAGRLMEAQRAWGVPMIVGAVTHENLKIAEGDTFDIGFDRTFNSALVVDEGRVQDVKYDKLHLTPFGEVMPYISAWPWLEQRLLSVGAAGMRFELSAGDGAERLQVPAGERLVRVATPICFEATMPGVMRELLGPAGGEAELFVQITNDGWFGESMASRESHLQIVRFRAMELATPLVRAANTGISAVVDARGVELGRVPSGEGGAASVLVAEVPTAYPGGGRTVYAQIGDVWAWVLTAIVPICVGLSYRGGRGRHGSGA